MTLAGSAFMFHLTNTLFKTALPETGAVAVEGVRRQALAAGVEVCPVHVPNDLGAIGAEGLVDVIGLGKAAGEFEDVRTQRAVGEDRAGSHGIEKTTHRSRDVG